ncbi:MAG: snoRNA-binding rRNA-processing protein utp10 [Bathelium mastoideum]|nr:MAG: snoRNA-binding rRNA-processing protein utp10 [Bathelium mastoideum]KAI9690377.1 MAG: snoRNA-binding rRNA-processing protein utp10 [Bathelium mastoideum]
MTSLQRQLAAIAANSTQQLDLKAQKAAHAKSLLFDPKIAASQSFDSIYQICQEGFQELCLLDTRFVPFSRNLFSEQSKAEDRTQMTAKENEELNSVLERFLALIGSRILLKPAHKTIEWLVRRFRFEILTISGTYKFCLLKLRIHEYNTQLTLLTFLPFHESQIFVSLLSILPENIPPVCRFLYPYTRSLTSPPRNVIVYTAEHNTTFFSAFNNHILRISRARYHSPALVAFWASIISQSLNGMLEQARSGRAEIQQRREEDLLLQVLPMINDGLSIPHVPELTLGCYLICTILATKGSLNDKTLDSLMETVAGTLRNDCLNSGLITLAVMAQERHSIKLPKAVTGLLLMFEDLWTQIYNISHQYRADQLAAGVVLAALRQSESFLCLKGIDLGVKLMVSGAFDDTQSSKIIKAFVEVVDRGGDGLAQNTPLSNALSFALQTVSNSPKLDPVLKQVLGQLQIDAESLEVKLNTLFKLQPELLPPEAIKEIPRSHESLEGTEELTLDDLVEKLPKQIPKMVSFFNEDNTALFEQLLQVFSRILDSGNGLGKFKTLEIWTQDMGCVLWSFCARAWCGPYSALIRSKALDLITQEIKSKQHGDEQILIPFFLHALADESAKVRKEALELGFAIEHRSNKESKTNRDNLRSAIYGHGAKEIAWLSTSEFGKVISTIAPKLEECVLDRSQISKVVQKALSKSQSTTGSAEDAEGPQLKSKVRAAFAEFLCSHISVLQSCRVKMQLLKMLGPVGKALSSSRIQYLQPELRRWANLSLQEASFLCAREHVEPAALDSAYFGILSAKDEGAVDLVRSIAQAGIGEGRQALQQAAFSRIRELWPNFSASSCLSLSNTLFEWSFESSSDAPSQIRQAEAITVLRTVSLSSEILVSFLDGIKSPAHMVDSQPATKKRRMSKSGNAKNDVLDKEELHQILRRITFTLGLIETSNSGRQPKLLRSLFHVLDELQQWKNHVAFDSTYLQTVTIATIFDIVSSTSETLSQEMAQFVRVDLLIDCLRTNSNPQVHNSVLLLISSLATWVPDRVLHSIMPIFTFMSRTLLEQSDEYSAHVVDKTVSQVVPPLLESLQKKSEDLSSSIAEILSSFVAAYEHIPFHRRLQLFRNLLRTIGPERSIYAVLIMLSDRYPRDTGIQIFTMELMNEFSVAEQITSCQKCLKVALNALQPDGSFPPLILGSNEKSRDQNTTLVVQIIQCLTRILDSWKLKASFANVRRSSEADLEAIQAQYHALLGRAIELEQSVHGEENLQLCIRELESAVLSLPPIIDFIEAAKRLLHGHPDEVRHRILLSFTTRLDSPDRRDSNVLSAILSFLPCAVQVMGETKSTRLKGAAISCIGNIVDRYGRKDLELTFESAKALASEQALGTDDTNIQIVALLNLAGMVEVLRDEFIPLLPQILSVGLQYLKSILSTEKPNLQLHGAVFQILTAVVECLPFMLSSKHLETSLTLSFESASMADDGELSESRKEFTDLVSRKLGFKELLSSLLPTWPKAVHAGPTAVEEFLSILKSGIEVHTNAQIIKNASALFTLFVQLFDLRYMTRREVMASFSQERTESLESLLFETALAMIFKMNDTVFRPYFIRLVEWASESRAGQDRQGWILRSITLFSFCKRLFDALKGVVTTYASHVLGHAVEVLQQCPGKGDAPPDYLTLVSSALQALRGSFNHDESDFWQVPSHFDPICQPLISLLDQLPLDNTDDGSYADSPLIKEILIPTIVSLATASSSLEHYKTINSHLLSYIRSQDFKVRLAAVKTERALTERLGEEWLGMLPEMVPYISELQEDDDEVVEKEAHRWIHQIEGVLGEGLDGMLQ